MSKQAALILVFAVILGTSLRIAFILTKNETARDEAHCFMTAAGQLSRHQDDMVAGRSPYATWVDASAWHSYFFPRKAFPLADIAHDHAYHDTHPPMHSWLLYLWSRVFGVGLGGTGLTPGRAFNVLIALLTTLSLFLFARATSKDAVVAAWVAVAWSIAPIVVTITGETRNYDQLGLFTVLFAWLVYRAMDVEVPLRRGDLVWLVIVTIFGALTHYLFTVFLVTGCAGAAVVSLFHAQRRRLAWILGAIVLGHLVSAAIHPDFYLSFLIDKQLREPFRSHELVIRAFDTARALPEFIVPEYVWRSSLEWLVPEALWVGFKFGCLGLAVVGMVVAAARGARALRRISLLRALEWVRQRPGHFYVFGVMTYVLSVHAFLYLSFNTQSGKMGQKYLAITWPFFAFAVIYIVRALSRARARALWAYAVVVTMFSVIDITTRWYVRTVHTREVEAVVRKASRVVAGSVHKEVFMPLVADLAPGTKVYAAPQPELAEHPERWVDDLLPGESILILYGNDIPHASYRGGTVDLEASKRMPDNDTTKGRILDFLSRRYEVSAQPGGLFGLRDVYRIGARTSTAGEGSLDRARAPSEHT